ncbi:MAG: TIGR00730 family Rossman fold protein [Clostridia bacterium]|nr:TIGR00730 family Rossman fold protein [Clostridia bacterium]
MNICVYGAASKEIDEKYLVQGERLGQLIAEGGHSLVFGGGATGMMGAVARGVHNGGGYILGVAPKFFDKEGVLYQQCDRFVFTETMRERKQIMEEESDAFVMSPGGLGTWEEFFEMITLRQLSQHTKPIIILNTEGYYDPLIELMEHAIRGKFLEKEARGYYMVADTPEQLMSLLQE